MDLNSRLTGTVHNVKNKLQLILPVVDTLLNSEDAQVYRAGEDIRRGLTDVNQQLVALLGLYRLDQNKLVSSDEVYVVDLLTSCAAFVPSAIEVEVDCQADQVGCFDENLVKSVVSDAIHNAVRYARSRILLSAHDTSRGILITVEDDGPGYEFDSASAQGSPDEISNDGEGTGLGFHFAEQVAKAHRNGEEYGSINLTTSTSLGGAAFSLFLP